MTFNVWLGGDVVDFGKVGEVIRSSGAGIVGLQEAEGQHVPDRAVGRLAVLERPAARRLALPADRPARGARLLRARADPPRAGARAGQRAPDVRPVRLARRARRAHAAAGAAAGALDAAAGDPRRAARRRTGSRAGPERTSMWLPPQEAGFFGEVTFGSGGLGAGRYDALLVTRGDRVLSRSTFRVVRRGARPQVVVPRRIRAGASLRIAWRGAPADRFDWVGIWKRADGADLYNSFAYTNATVAGATRIRLGRADYPPGEYVVRLMRDDGYAVLDAARLTVLPRGRP
jgi:hypothetical protein